MSGRQARRARPEPHLGIYLNLARAVFKSSKTLWASGELIRLRGGEASEVRDGSKKSPCAREPPHAYVV